MYRVSIQLLFSFWVIFSSAISKGQIATDPNVVLFKTAMKELESAEKIESSDIRNALGAALVIGSDELVQETIRRFQIESPVLFETICENAASIQNLSTALSGVNAEDLEQDHLHQASILAYGLGLQSTEFQPLKEIISTVRDIDPISVNDWEELKFNYLAGKILSKSNDQIRTDIDDFREKRFSDFLRSLMVRKIGLVTGVASVSIEEVERIESPQLRSRALVAILNQTSSVQHAPEDGQRLARSLVESYFQNRPSGDIDSYDWKFKRVETLRESFTEEVTPKKVVEICSETQLISLESDFLAYVKNVEVKYASKNEGYLKRWATLVAGVYLEMNQFELAEAIANEYSIELPLEELAHYAIRHNEFELLDDRMPKVRIERLASGDRDAIYSGISKFQRKRLLESFERDFQKQPDNKKLRWLLEYIWISRDYQRFDGKQRLALEPEIKAKFEGFKPLAGTAARVAGTYDIFLGTGDANRELLDDLMKSLPEENRVITKYQIGLMEKEIQKSSVESQASLLEQAVEIARATKQTGQDFHDFSGRLAFAFAKTGNRKAVDGIAREIVDSKRQAWILFQCIRAMPASEPSNQRSRYESYSAGGLF